MSLALLGSLGSVGAAEAGEGAPGALAPDAGVPAAPLDAGSSAADYRLPQRVLCRTGKNLRLEVEQRALVVHGLSIVSGKTVSQMKELAPGSCAALASPENDIGTDKQPSYVVFGPKVAGPVAVEMNSHIHVEVSAGIVSKIGLGGDDPTRTAAADPLDAQFAAFVAWFRASDGAFEAGISARPDHPRGTIRVGLEGGFRKVDLVPQTWSAPRYPTAPKPPTGVEPSAANLRVPRRVHCRAPIAASFRRVGDALEVPLVPVAGRVTRSPSDLRPGECAGALVVENEDGAGGHQAFGAAVTGPLLARWNGSQATSFGALQLGIAKDGRLSSVRHTATLTIRPPPTGAAAEQLRNLGTWLQGTPGGFEAAAHRDPNLPNASSFGLPMTYLRTEAVR